MLNLVDPIAESLSPGSVRVKANGTTRKTIQTSMITMTTTTMM
jgi:hypothetical protein